MAAIFNSVQGIYRDHLRTRSVGELSREKGYFSNWPVLIIPGFMSSGLEVEQSQVKPDWNQERIWISLQKLGIKEKKQETNENFEVDDDLTEMMERSMRINTSLNSTLIDPMERSRPNVESNTLSRHLRLPPRYTETVEEDHVVDGDEAIVTSPIDAAPPLPPRLPPRSSTTLVAPVEDNGNPFRRASSPNVSPNQPIKPSQPTSQFLSEPRVPVEQSMETIDIPSLSPAAQLPRSMSRTDTMPPEEKTLRRAWLQHMTLADNRRSDPQNGKIVVRSMKGIEGVDFLQPGFVMDFATYVFGPIIANLKWVGYNDKNLQAAPYDWRIAPVDLEKRDRYFSKLAQQILDMKAANGGKPVVILAHSMGCRVAHFWCKWVERNPYMGASWLKTHVHSIVALGGPFLGASKSIRGLITGDSMGLPFLSQDEAVWFSRSLATPPFLLNNGSWAPLWEKLSNDTFGFVRLEGCLYVTVKNGSVPAGSYNDTGLPSCYIVLHWRGRILKSSISKGHFPVWNDTFQLVSPFPDRLESSDVHVLRVQLFEANKVRQDEMLGSIDMDLGVLYQRAMEKNPMEKSIMLFHDNIQYKRKGPVPTLGMACAFLPVDQRNMASDKVIRASKPGSVNQWQGICSMDLLEMDGAPKTKQLVHDLYDMDPHFGQPFGQVPGYSGISPPAYLTPPQVNRVHLVYGTNVPTEVAFMARRRHTRITRGPDGEPWHLLKLDKDGSVPPDSTLTARSGIIYETKNTRQTEPIPVKGPDGKPTQTRFVSGDGTVPYCSLRYPMHWNQMGTPVTCFEVSDADHRGMLNDDRVVQHILDYVCLVPAIPRQVISTTAEKVKDVGGLAIRGIKSVLKK
jgi:hypothetical protein